MTQLIIDLPDDVRDALRLPVDEVERLARRELAVALHRRAALPFGPASALAQMTQREFEFLLTQRGLDTHFAQRQSHFAVERPAVHADRPVTHSDRPAGRAARPVPHADRPAGRAARPVPHADRPAGRASAFSWESLIVNLGNTTGRDLHPRAQQHLGPAEAGPRFSCPSP